MASIGKLPVEICEIIAQSLSESDKQNMSILPNFRSIKLFGSDYDFAEYGKSYYNQIVSLNINYHELLKNKKIIIPKCCKKLVIYDKSGDENMILPNIILQDKINEYKEITHIKLHITISLIIGGFDKFINIISLDICTESNIESIFSNLINLKEVVLENLSKTAYLDFSNNLKLTKLSINKYDSNNLLNINIINNIMLEEISLLNCNIFDFSHLVNLKNLLIMYPKFAPHNQINLGQLMLEKLKISLDIYITEYNHYVHENTPYICPNNWTIKNYILPTRYLLTRDDLLINIKSYFALDKIYYFIDNKK